MKLLFCLLALSTLSNPVWGKEKHLLIGSSVWISPEIGYDSIKAPGNNRISGVEEEHKTTMGVSVEFIAPQPDGNFFSLGTDIFFESKYKDNPDVKLAPMSLFANFGIWEPYCVNLNARLFAGIGGMFLNYSSLNESADYTDSLGLSYQFGAGIVTPKLFVDILMRGGLGSLERRFEGLNNLVESDYSFSSAMLKVGLVF